MKKHKKFNTTGVCVPALHYMVDISHTINVIIEKYIENGEYFTINRARQYGKTTTLEQLYQKLKEKYIVIPISLEAADDYFTSAYTLAQGLVKKIADAFSENDIPAECVDSWKEPLSSDFPMNDLSAKISELCRNCSKGVVLMVDEVDKSADNKLFLLFLGLLREKYLKQMVGRDATFQSVILAGVYDIKNLKLKLHPQEESKYNSPWNIAADFTVDMSLAQNGIEGMLLEYEQDYHTGMDCKENARMIYEYTKGYPFLVSYICKKIEEELAGSSEFPTRSAAWSRSGILAAVKLLVNGPNTLYDDMIKKVMEYPELHDMLNNILFSGQEYAYHEYDQPVNIGKMFGFLVNKDGVAAVANRIFETQLYTYFLAEETRKNHRQREALPEKSQFICDGKINMDLVMEKFYEYYTELYSEDDSAFVEKYGQKIFLLYLRPVINGVGNFYVEDQSRTRLRSDIVIDYRGEQFIVECKIWRGQQYVQSGVEQLKGYMDAYHVKKGYLLVFNFNKKKDTGIRKIPYRDKEIMEIIV